MSPSAEAGLSSLDDEIEVVDHPPYLKRRREPVDLPPSKTPKGTSTSDTSSIHRSDAGPSAGTIVIPPPTVRPSEKSKGKAKEGATKPKTRVKASPVHASPDKMSSHSVPKTTREFSTGFISLFLICFSSSYLNSRLWRYGWGPFFKGGP